MALHNVQHGLAQCPGCQTSLAAPLTHAGRTVRCNCCGARFTLPSHQDLFEDAVAYLVDHEPDPVDEVAMDDVIPQIQRDTLAQA